MFFLICLLIKQDNRKSYRDTLYSTEGISESLSGIIFNAEALD